VSFHAAGRPAFLVNWPQHAERVLALNESNYKNPYHPYRELSGHYEPAGSALLQVSRGASAKDLEQTTSELTRAALNISSDIQVSSKTGPVKLITPLRKWVFCAIARLLFGVNAEHLGDAFVTASHFAEECWANNLFTLPSSSPSEMEQHYRSAVETQERTAGWIAQEARMVPQNCAVPESVKVAIVRTLLNGYNATATTVCWAIYLILQRDEVRTKLYREIDATMAQQKLEGHNPTQPSYLKMVIKETLRLYPPAWVLGREALGNDRLGHTFIPKGSQVFVSPYTMQRHTLLWKCSNDFIPERFGSPPPATPVAYSYFPFGSGERRCPAGRFVVSHLHVLISALLGSCYLELGSTDPVSPRGLIALHPQPDVSVTATPRGSLHRNRS
jgi:hypothetical protein